MKIRPILFSPEMSTAVREGRKTQTRRIVKGGPFVDQETYRVSEQPSPSDCPYGKVGDILYGRERFHKHPETDEVLFPDSFTSWMRLYPSIHMPRDAARIWLRITNVRVERLIEITEQDAIAEGVRENLCDDTSKCPSFQGKCCGKGEWYNYSGIEMEPCYSAKESFATLWEAINGAASWNDNPIVWVIEFTPCEKPIKLENE